MYFETEDLKHWSRTLLKWINECNLAENYFLSIERSDIEAFYTEFSSRLKCEDKDLRSFLKKNYPFFEPHFVDDSHQLSSTDYVYVYSLLLHFSCVKCSDEFFQKKCQQLNEAEQQNIKSYFKKLLEVNSFKKESIRSVIASITMPSPHSVTHLRFIESPIRTPQKSEISPPTPRSCRLNEKNRELHNLKVRLENELYERGMLEIEVKQNQEKVIKLSGELKKSLQEIQELKNDIFSRNNESVSEVKNSEEEQLKRKLCKEISQKEVKIAKQNEDIEALTEQNDTLNKKLTLAEKQINVYQNKIQDLTILLEDLTNDLEQKEAMFHCLLEEKQELEKYVNEIRSTSANSRPDLNVSVEFLDVSRTTNSSGSINSPENLGCSVVDIQLREKERENIQLQQEISSIRMDNVKLSKHLCDLTVRYSKYFDICKENLIIEQENDSAVENFMVFSNYVEKFIQKYEEKCTAFNELQKNAKTLKEDLTLTIGKVKNELSNTEKENIKLKADNATLHTTNSTLENEAREWKEKLNIASKKQIADEQQFESIQKELKNQINDLKSNIENNKNQLSKLECDFKSKEEDLISQIKKINDNFVQEKIEIMSQNQTEKKLLEEKLKQSLDTISENKKKSNQLEVDMQDHANKVMSLSSQLQEKTSLVHALEKEKHCLGLEIEDLKSTLQQSVNNMCANVNKIEQFELEKPKLLNKIYKGETQLQEKNNLINDLEKEKSSLLGEVGNLKLNLKQSLDVNCVYVKQIEELEFQKRDFTNKISDLQSQFDFKEKEYMKVLQGKNDLIDELEKEKCSLDIELDALKQVCERISNEKQFLLEEANKINIQHSLLTKALADNKQTLQVITDDRNQQRYCLSKAYAENLTLIDLVNERIIAMKSTIDQHERYFMVQIQELEEQNKKATDEIVRTQTDLKKSRSEFDDISSMYSDSRQRTDQVLSFVDDLMNRLRIIIQNIDLEKHGCEYDFKEHIYSGSQNSIESVENVKHYFNVLVQNIEQMSLLLKKNKSETAGLSDDVKILKQQKNDLEKTLLISEQRILELRDDFKSESACEQNKLLIEAKRLNDNISNLKKVCENLRKEKSLLQLKLGEFEKENTLLREKADVLESECKNHLSMADKLINTETELRVQVLDMQSSVKKLELDIERMQTILSAKSHDADTFLRQRDEVEKVNASLKKQISEQQSQMNDIKLRLEKLNHQYESTEKENREKTNEQSAKFENIKIQLEGEVIEKIKIKEKLENANKNVADLLNQKTVLEEKYQLMDKQLNKIRHDLESSRTDLVALKYEEARLLGELELLKEKKNFSELQVEKCNQDVGEQKDNISRLIKEIASIRKEKDCAEEEKNILQKRFDEKANRCIALEEEHKINIEQVKLLEKDLLTKQNLLKSEQQKVEDIEIQLKKMQKDNMKLKENNESSNKRVEKQALRLGEAQAKSQKLKKEAETAQNSLESLKASTEATQRENSKLNIECKLLKEKLLKCERSCEQLDSKIQQLTKANESLRAEKENSEKSDFEIKSSKDVLEKNKACLEDKIRKLTKSVNESNVLINRLEQDKVQLHLEVGGLNTLLQESKTLLAQKINELQEVTTSFIEIKNAKMQLMELNEKLQQESTDIRDENSSLNDQLSKVSLRLKMTNEDLENTRDELKALKADNKRNEVEKDAIEKEHNTTITRLKEIEKLVDQRCTTELELLNKIKYLDTRLAKIATEFQNLQEIRKVEKQSNEKLNTDISILQAKLHKSRLICEDNEKKYHEEKEKLLLEVKLSEERIKETRLELEGKLEKMKNKMKTLYNDEISKMKKKQEREVAVMKSELDGIRVQKEKYDEHMKKLSSQIFRLNENILEHQKQNNFLKTKLKDLESKPRQLNRMSMSQLPTSSSASTALSSNLHMEDEEGEVFNNTYLSDLKSGRMSELCSRDICPQELQYRNSLLPPHLKSTYLAQFDHQMDEDEIRETPSLDDSLSTLLNTGQRKKVSGATSYKRPGPPTPSKNAGRLSFGGSGEPNREILKETPDTRNGPSSSKTPAKFKLFSSKLCLKDEHKNYLTRFKQKQQVLVTMHCSSTPRKSKAHFNARRVLDQFMSKASPGNPTHNNFSPTLNLPSALKDSELKRRGIIQKCRLSNSSSATTADSATSDINSPKIHFKNVSKRFRRVKNRRASINLKGGMFARNGQNSVIRCREGFKMRSKMQRNANFNKYRNKIVNQMIVKKAYSNNNYFLEKNLENITNEKSKDEHFSSRDSAFNEDVNNDKRLRHFHQLLTRKESQAPFTISEISGPSIISVNSSSTVHSRTIYGASVILNRRIPNVNTTLVRKSSIYVKGNDEHGIILVTNQTITLKDLACMWIQMNMPAKVVFVLSLTTLCAVMYSFVVNMVSYWLRTKQ